MKSTNSGEQCKPYLDNDEIWMTHIKRIRRLVKRYGQDADDIMQSAYIIFRNRNRNFEPTSSYFKCIFKEAARNLKIYQSLLSIEQLSENGWETSAPDSHETIEQRMRISTAIEHFPQLINAVELVLGGASMQYAAAAASISPSRFTELLRRAGTHLNYRGKNK